MLEKMTDEKMNKIGNHISEIFESYTGEYRRKILDEYVAKLKTDEELDWVYKLIESETLKRQLSTR